MMRKAVRLGGAAGVAAGLLLALLRLWPLPVEQLEVPASLQVLDRQGTPLRIFVNSEDAFHFPVTLDEVSPFLVQATLLFEDRHFFRHPGLNPVAIVRALRLNRRSGRVVSGGSTITQQVARLMAPAPRTVGTKAAEAWRALQLEARYSKRHILQLYLNHAPFGGNLVGIGAASWFYFGKPAAELGPGEAALLAALPNAPSRLRPDRYAEMARSRRDEVLRRMWARGVIDDQRYRRALEEEMPPVRHQVPMEAPHLADMVLARHGRDGSQVATTIDHALQQDAERLLERHLAAFRPRGVSNGAIVIIENQSRQVRALVGSADYADERIAGQVNGARALRSPGSLLKPFLYALAFQAGAATPRSLLEDIPVSYAGYTPENFDGTYGGIVTVHEALVRSMNVPAVHLLHRLGLERFLLFMQQGGITSLDRPAEYYGLPLVLGGAGFSLLELTNLYACLADGGQFKPLRIEQGGAEPAPVRVIDPGAAWLVTGILSELVRPDLPAVWEAGLTIPRVAWKTGTSYGHRDAWSIGYTPRYTVGVWIGNFSGTPSPALVGAEAAAPLFFDLIKRLEPEGGNWFRRPGSVEERQVCVLSGMPAGPACTDTRSEWYLPDRTPPQACTYHVSVALDADSGERLCALCLDGRRVERKDFVIWPASLAGWMQRSGHPVESIPAHAADCPSVLAGQAPVIRSPVADLEYLLRSRVPIEYQQIRLEASVPNDVHTIYWFVNGSLYFAGDPGREVFWPPVPGRHEIVCMDDEGRSSRVELVVRDSG